jgi:tripeptide aminopeptidase
VLVTAVRAAKKIGIRPIIKMTGGGSDANIFSAKGLPCVIIGAGADRVHTVHERASISHMNRSAEFLVQIIKEFSCTKKL